MLYSKIFQSALTVLSLSAAATALPAQDTSVRVFSDINYSGFSRGTNLGGCTNLEEVELFHHLGSAQIPDGYSCSLYFDPNCIKSPICILAGSQPDLLTLKGNPCPNAMEFGVGHGVESVACSKIGH